MRNAAGVFARAIPVVSVLPQTDSTGMPKCRLKFRMVSGRVYMPPLSAMRNAPRSASAQCVISMSYIGASPIMQVTPRSRMVRAIVFGLISSSSTMVPPRESARANSSWGWANEANMHRWTSSRVKPKASTADLVFQ